jgi:hypothetical protein
MEQTEYSMKNINDLNINSTKLNLPYDLELLDGGFVFELNKKYDDCGIYAMENDWDIVKEIH